MHIKQVSKTRTRRNSTGQELSARRINFIEGANADITIRKDVTNNELDITLDASKVQVGVHTSPTTLSDLETDLGVTFDYKIIYKTINELTTITDSFYTSSLDTLNSDHGLLLDLELENSAGNGNLADIKNGVYDTQLNAIADLIVADGREIKLAFLHEFNGNWYDWGIYKSGNTPSDLPLAYQHIVNVFRAKNAPVKFVFWYNRDNANDNLPYSTYYPGDSYVDIIAVSAYNRAGVTYNMFHSIEWQLDNFYAQVCSFSSRPIMIGETSSTNTYGSKAYWMKNIFETVRDRFPRIKYLTFFFEDKSGSGSGNWTLEDAQQKDMFVEGFTALNNRTGNTWAKPISPNLIKGQYGSQTSIFTQTGSRAGLLSSTATDVPYHASPFTRSYYLTHSGPSISAFQNEAYQLVPSGTITPMQQYSMSFWARTSSASPFQFDIGLRPHNLSVPVAGLVNQMVDNVWKKYEVVISLTSANVSGVSAGSQWRVPDIRIGHNQNSGTFFWHGLKIERNETPTASIDNSVFVDRPLFKDGLNTTGTLDIGFTTGASGASGYGKLYVKPSDSLLYYQTPTGTEYDLTATGSGTGTIGGSGVANKMAYWTNASMLSGATSVHWDSSNNWLGIGTSSPAERLTLATTVGSLGLGIRNSSNATLNDHAKIFTRVGGSSAGDPGIQMTVGGVVDWSIGIDNSDGDKLKIDTSDVIGGDTKMLIDTTGKIGVGKTTPTEKLHVAGNYVLDDADTATKSYRFRTTGTDLDFDFAGANMVLSGYPNADYTGTQKMYMIMGSTFDFLTAYGNWEWKDRSGGQVQHQINGESGVVFNEQGADRDVRIEGDTNANLVVVDASADSVGFGTATPSTKAIVELSSTTKGFLPPRMTTTERDAITSVPAGLMIYNTSTNKLNFYNGSSWEAVTSA